MFSCRRSNGARAIRKRRLTIPEKINMGKIQEQDTLVLLRKVNRENIKTKLSLKPPDVLSSFVGYTYAGVTYHISYTSGSPLN